MWLQGGGTRRPVDRSYSYRRGGKPAPATSSSSNAAQWRMPKKKKALPHAIICPFTFRSLGRWLGTSRTHFSCTFEGVEARLRACTEYKTRCRLRTRTNTGSALNPVTIGSSTPTCVRSEQEIRIHGALTAAYLNRGPWRGDNQSPAESHRMVRQDQQLRPRDMDSGSELWRLMTSHPSVLQLAIQFWVSLCDLSRDCWSILLVATRILLLTSRPHLSGHPITPNLVSDGFLRTKSPVQLQQTWTRSTHSASCRQVPQCRDSGQH